MPAGCKSFRVLAARALEMWRRARVLDMPFPCRTRIPFHLAKCNTSTTEEYESTLFHFIKQWYSNALRDPAVFIVADSSYIPYRLHAHVLYPSYTYIYGHTSQHFDGIHSFHHNYPSSLYNCTAFVLSLCQLRGYSLSLALSRVSLNLQCMPQPVKNTKHRQ